MGRGGGGILGTVLFARGVTSLESFEGAGGDSLRLAGKELSVFGLELVGESVREDERDEFEPLD